jgi:hypothetical protein
MLEQPLEHRMFLRDQQRGTEHPYARIAQSADVQALHAKCQRRSCRPQRNQADGRGIAFEHRERQRARLVATGEMIEVRRALVEQSLVPPLVNERVPCVAHARHARVRIMWDDPDAIHQQCERLLVFPRHALQPNSPAGARKIRQKVGRSRKERPMNAVEMRIDDAVVRVAPDLGAAITSYQWRDRPVLRAAADAAPGSRSVRMTSCYPLVPYSNRIRDARLRFRGRDYALARNFGSHPHAIPWAGLAARVVGRRRATTSRATDTRPRCR